MISLDRAVSRLFGSAVRITSTRSVCGGSINEAFLVVLTSGDTCFVKRNRSSLRGMFAAEAAGLKALNTGDIRIPRCFGYEDNGEEQFIFLEALAQGVKDAGFFRRFGRAFASLHKNNSSASFGFAHDNYIGSTVQKNGWKKTFAEFFRENRLGFQLDLAVSLGRLSSAERALAERLLERLDAILPHDAFASLVHGDLWGGNYLCDEKGNAVLIDPAAHYGLREADVAMTELFGGFSPDFYRGYNEVFPLNESYDELKQLYNLYHLFNHLNLFGSSYKSQVMSVIRTFV